MKIILGVCGSISAYKSIDLARALQKQGDEVKVVLTAGALNFVKPEVFSYLGIKCYNFDEDFKHAGVLHIELARWCQRLFIAPASANTISKLSAGNCDDLLSSVFLSLEKEKPKVLCPAMNTLMLNNEATNQNISNLKSRGIFFVDSNEGVLACGDEGAGKLPTIQELSEILPLFSLNQKNKKVIITAGATVSNIDSVRFVTNPAKGGQSYVLAKEALSRGYSVHVIRGRDVIEEFSYLKKHPNYSESLVITTDDLLTRVKEIKGDFWAYISPMAVSDIKFTSSNTKLKKSDLKKSLDIEVAPDVLKFVLDHKKEGQKIIGFAAESTLADEIIDEKIKRKPVDLLVANEADSGLTGSKAKGFGQRRGNYRFKAKNLDLNFKDLPKEDVAVKIFDFLEDK